MCRGGCACVEVPYHFFWKRSLIFVTIRIQTCSSVRPHNQRLSFCARYVDDIFCICKGVCTQPSKCLSRIPHHPLCHEIKFTYELETENQLKFLHLIIIGTRSKLQLKMYCNIHMYSVNLSTSNSHHGPMYRLMNVRIINTEFSDEVCN